MKVWAVVAALAVALLASYSLGADASKGTPGGLIGEVWLPLHVPPTGERWIATENGTPAWQVMYAKQYDQTVFRICGRWQGHGELLLSYAGEGDPVPVDFDTPTQMCFNTPVGAGGGENAFQLSLYMRSEVPARALNVRDPNVFVLNQ